MHLEDHIIIWGVISFLIIVFIFFVPKPPSQEVTIHSVGEQLVNQTSDDEENNEQHVDLAGNDTVQSMPSELSESNPLTFSVSDNVEVTSSQAAVSEEVVHRRSGGGNHVVDDGGANNSVHTYALELFEGSEESDGVVDLGQQVRAVASTDDPDVGKVIFRWIDPSAVTVRAFETPLDSSEMAQDVFELGEPEVWIVEADFGNGHVLQKSLDVRFFVVPESPVGALVLLVSSVVTIISYYVVHTRRQSSRRNWDDGILSV